jgi:hypothetical protein
METYSPSCSLEDNLSNQFEIIFRTNTLSYCKSVSRSLDLDFGNKDHRGTELPGAELTSEPASVASILLVSRVQLGISIFLAMRPLALTGILHL